MKRFSGSASNIGLAYTWSKAINYADNSESGITWNQVSIHERNRALAGYDRPHNLSVYGNYELPFGKGRAHVTSGFGSMLLGGWQLNGLFTAQSGTPFTVGSNGASLNAVSNAQTADQVKPTVDKLFNVSWGQLVRSLRLRSGNPSRFRIDWPQLTKGPGPRESGRQRFP